MPDLPSLLAQRPRDQAPDLVPNTLASGFLEPLVQPLPPTSLTLSPHHSLHPSLPPAPYPLASNHSHRHTTHYPANAPYLARVPSPMLVNYPSNHGHSFKTRHPPYKNPKITRLLGMVFLLEIYSWKNEDHSEKWMYFEPKKKSRILTTPEPHHPFYSSNSDYLSSGLPNSYPKPPKQQIHHHKPQ